MLTFAGAMNIVGPPPPAPPENIVTEADRQAQVQYETWLRTTNVAVSQQIRYFETEVQKLRKIRKVRVTEYFTNI